MNEKTEAYIKLALKNLDRIVVGVLLALFGVIIYFFQSETADTGDRPEAKEHKVEDKILKNETFVAMSTYSDAPDITKNATIDQVRRFNMFDFKSVRDRADIERRANEQFQKAKAAADAGRKQEAITILNEILVSVPTYQQARELLNKLNK